MLVPVTLPGGWGEIIMVEPVVGMGGGLGMPPMGKLCGGCVDWGAVLVPVTLPGGGGAMIVVEPVVGMGGVFAWPPMGEALLGPC